MVTQVQCCDYSTPAGGKRTSHRYSTCVMCTLSPERSVGRRRSDFLLYLWAGSWHYRAQLGAAPFCIGEVQPAGTARRLGEYTAHPGSHITFDKHDRRTTG